MYSESNRRYLFIFFFLYLYIYNEYRYGTFHWLSVCISILFIGCIHILFSFTEWIFFVTYCRTNIIDCQSYINSEYTYSNEYWSNADIDFHSFFCYFYGFIDDTRNV